MSKRKGKNKLPPKTLQIYGVLGDSRGVVSMNQILTDPPLGKSMKRMREVQNRKSNERFSQEVIKLPHLQIIETDKKHLQEATKFLSSPKPEEYEKLRSRCRAFKLDNKRISNERDQCWKEIKSLKYRLENPSGETVHIGKYKKLQQSVAETEEKMIMVQSQLDKAIQECEILNVKVATMENTASKEYNLINKLNTSLDKIMSVGESEEGVDFEDTNGYADCIIHLVEKFKEFGGKYNVLTNELKCGKDEHAQTSEQLKSSRNDLEAASTLLAESQASLTQLRTGIDSAFTKLMQSIDLVPSEQPAHQNLSKGISDVVAAMETVKQNAALAPSALRLLMRLEEQLEISTVEPGSEESKCKTDMNLVNKIDERIDIVMDSLQKRIMSAEADNTSKKETLDAGEPNAGGVKSQVLATETNVTKESNKNKNTDDTETQTALVGDVQDTLEMKEEQGNNEGNSGLTSPQEGASAVQKPDGDDAHEGESSGFALNDQDSSTGLEENGDTEGADTPNLGSDGGTGEANSESSRLKDIEKILGIKDEGDNVGDRFSHILSKLNDQQTLLDSNTKKMEELSKERTELQEKLLGLKGFQEEHEQVKENLVIKEKELEEKQVEIETLQKDLQVVTEKLNASSEEFKVSIATLWRSMSKPEEEFPSDETLGNCINKVKEACEEVTSRSSADKEKIAEITTQLEESESENESLRLQTAQVSQGLAVLISGASYTPGMSEDDRLLVESNTMLKPLLTALDEAQSGMMDDGLGAQLPEGDTGLECEDGIENIFDDEDMGIRKSSVTADPWKESIDEESGSPYYTNIATGEVQWEKPDCLI